MPPVDPAVLAERLAAVDRHLRRVPDRLPADPADLYPVSAARSGPPDLRAFAAALLRAEGLAAG